MPEFKTEALMDIYSGLMSLGDLASVPLPNLKEAKEQGIAEGDLKAGVKARQKIRIRTAAMLIKLEPTIKAFQKQANDALEEAALKKDGQPDMGEIEGPGGAKQQTVKLDPEKLEAYKVKMDTLNEHLVDDITMNHPFTEQDFEQAMLTVSTRTMVLLGPMIKLD